MGRIGPCCSHSTLAFALETACGSEMVFCKGIEQGTTRLGTVSPLRILPCAAWLGRGATSSLASGNGRSEMAFIVPLRMIGKERDALRARCGGLGHASVQRKAPVDCDAV